MKKTDNKGFSLVELIVVIAIMAVLIGVLAPTFTKYVERSKKSTDVQNVASMISAVQIYAADPMVATGDQLTAGDITLTLSTTKKTLTGSETDKIQKALYAAGIKEYQLKSNKWNGGSDVVITFTVDSAGAITVKQTTPAVSNTQKNDIVNGVYE